VLTRWRNAFIKDDALRVDLDRMLPGDDSSCGHLP
jgi:hypothetical protein